MAATAGGSQKRDNRLNLLSPEFDPELALSAPDVPVPFPDVAPLNNIAECRRLLPAGHASAVRPEDERDHTAGSRHARAPPTDKPPPPPPAASSSALTKKRLAARNYDELSQGPLKLMWTLRRKLVRVVVHRGAGLRAILEGRLQLYDKNLNMVLREVTEHYVHAPAGCGGSSVDAAASGGSSSAGNGGCSSGDGAAIQARWRLRTADQLLVRGACVVSVSRLFDQRRARPVFPSHAARRAFWARAVLADGSGEADGTAAAAAAAAIPEFGHESKEGATDGCPRLCGSEDARGGEAQRAVALDEEVAEEMADDEMMGEEEDGEEEEEEEEDAAWDDSEHLEHFEQHWTASTDRG